MVDTPGERPAGGAELDRLLDSFDREMKGWEERAAAASGKAIDAVYPDFRAQLERLFDHLKVLEHELRAAEKSDDLERLKERFRRRACEPWFFRSRYNEHGFRKPFGYAGDFQMIEMIYRGEPRESGLERLFDLFFLDCSAARAVVARRYWIGERVRQMLAGWRRPREPIVVNIGCGPGLDVLDYADLLEKLHGRAILVDFEPRALEFAEAHLRSAHPGVRYEFVRLNVRDYLGNRSQTLADRYGDRIDVLYSTGVMDYVSSDRTFERLIELFSRSLASGGLCVIGNFDPANQSRTYMEWVGDWNLVYRSKEQLLEDADRACGEDIEVSVEEEETGTNNLLLLRKRF